MNTIQEYQNELRSLGDFAQAYGLSEEITQLIEDGFKMIESIAQHTVLAEDLVNV